MKEDMRTKKASEFERPSSENAESPANARGRRRGSICYYGFTLGRRRLGNGCLPHASSAEQFAAFRDNVKSTETKPVKAYNAATKRKCRCILRVPGLPADNPQQSEEASHMGSNANHPTNATFLVLCEARGRSARICRGSCSWLCMEIRRESRICNEQLERRTKLCSRWMS